jgi:ferritin-like metal-binding protein YciE
MMEIVRGAFDNSRMEDTMGNRTFATLDEFFMDEMSVMLEAEHRFLEAQRAMLDGAAAAGLRSLIDVHIAESLEQVDALRNAFAALGARPRRVRCYPAEGLIATSKAAMSEVRDPAQLLDCAIASSLAKVEHYEVAAYRGLVAMSKEMERDDLMEILLANLEQEEEMVTRVESAYPELIRKAAHEVVEG